MSLCPLGEVTDIPTVAIYCIYPVFFFFFCRRIVTRFFTNANIQVHQSFISAGDLRESTGLQLCVHLSKMKV